jgi:ferredoxin
VTKLPGWPESVKPADEFTINIVGKGSLMARAGEPILNSLERAGYQLRCVCRSGKCSYCRTRLVSGKVFVPQQAEVRESDRARNFLHTCVSYPLEELTIRF